MENIPFGLLGSKSRKNVSEDILFGKTFLDNVCAIINSIQPPFTLGVSGEWGKGKTTLFNFLIETLNKQYATVYFSAWEFQRSINLIPALVEEIRSQIGIEEARWKSGTEKLLSILRLLPIELGVPGAKIAPDRIAYLRDSIKGYNRDKRELKKEISESVSEFVIREHKKALLIFIDDLDRCLPEVALEFLENIKNFLSVEKTIFIIALDEMVIDTALRTRYGQRTKVSGLDYLGKIIDLSIKMPHYTQDKLTQFFVRSLPPSDSLGKEAFKQVVGYLMNSNSLVTANTVVNPRHMGHILKKFALIAWINRREDRSPKELTVDFIMLIVKEYFCPIYTSILLKDAEIIIDLAIYEKGAKIGHAQYGKGRPRDTGRIRELYGQETAELYANRELHCLAAALIDKALCLSTDETLYLKALQDSARKLEIV